MSRYTLLFLLNAPFIALAILSTITRYKMKHSSKQRFIFNIILWCCILVGLLSAEAIYTYLFNNELTKTEPLSLFDVVQITAIVILFYLINQASSRIENLEHRLHALHRELSIKLSK